VTDAPPGEAARPPTPRGPSPRGITLALVVVLASAAGGYWAHHLNRRPTAYVAPSAPAPTPLPPGAPDAPAARKIPERVPTLTLPDVRGKPHGLAEWSGRPLLVNFWATWCEPCQREIPLLKTIRREYAANGVEIVGIALDSAGAVSKYATDHAMGYPILVGERGGLEAAAAFGMDTVLPFTVFADSRGEIVGLKIGELHQDEADLILGLVRQVDDGKLTLEAARHQVSETLPHLGAARAGSGDAAAQ
jgi:thiol-disulfide isomerase/thioredoxin